MFFNKKPQPEDCSFMDENASIIVETPSFDILLRSSLLTSLKHAVFSGFPGFLNNFRIGGAAGAPGIRNIKAVKNLKFQRSAHLVVSARILPWLTLA